MPVTTESIITADYFNTIQSKISSVIFDEYGYISQYPSQQVSTGTIITAEHWKNLFYDITKCTIHQTNSDIPGFVYTTTNITTTTLISAAFANALETAANDAYTNRYTIHPSQKIVDVITDVRTLPWNGTIGHSSVFNFDDQTNPELDLLYWLNLGGSLSLQLTYPNESYTGYDLYWKNLIDSLNGVLSSYTFNRTNSSTYILSYPGTDGGEDIDSDPDGIIDINIIKNGNSLTIETNLYPQSPDMISEGLNINVGVDITLVSSSGINGPIPYGIPSAVPIIEDVDFDETGITISLIKYLKTNPRSLTYTFERGQTSGQQTITLFNRGNDTVTISDIIFTGGTVGVTAIPIYSWGSTPSTTIAPLDSKTFNLSYTYSGGYEGENFTTITIISDGVVNPLVIDVKQIIQKPIFDFTLTPNTWNYTTSTIDIIGQDFTIVPKLFTNYTSYTASISPSLSGFSVQSKQGSLPRVEFNPFLATGGTYTPVLTVQATDGVTTVSRTANINIVYNEAPSQHLGSWLSAGAYNNAIVGASYDIIRGVRYLTVGIGVGSEDGTPEIIGGGLQYAIVGNLGINADSKIKSGTALFKTPFNSSYSQFLNEYGVWVRSSNNYGPLNVFVNRVYKFNVSSEGIYNWIFAIDEYGFVRIDEIVLADRSSTAANVSTTISGTVYLTAGEHTISLSMANKTDVASVAFRLFNSTTEIWNTLTPVRSSIPYYYWKEVYRIPLTKGAFTYDSKDYSVKDFIPIANYRYGGYFQNGNLFKVIDDGFGNLEILLQQKNANVNDSGIENTLKNLQYSFYYYVQYLSDNQRVNQLGSPIGSQTEYFVGFTYTGQVITRLVNYLTFGTQVVVWDTSAPSDGSVNTGGGGGWTDTNGFPIVDSQGNQIGGGGDVGGITAAAAIAAAIAAEASAVSVAEAAANAAAIAEASALGLDTGTAGTSTGGGGGDGGSSCFITTAACEYKGFDDKCYVLETLRKFRDDYMLIDSEKIKDIQLYYTEAPIIVSALSNNKLIYNEMWDNYILPAVKCIENNDLNQAYEIYKKGFLFAKNKAIEFGASFHS